MNNDVKRAQKNSGKSIKNKVNVFFGERSYEDSILCFGCQVPKEVIWKNHEMGKQKKR